MGGHPWEGLSVISHILKVDTHHFLRPVAMLPTHVWFADCALPKILDPGVPNTLYTEKGLSTDLDPPVDGGDHKILKKRSFFSLACLLLVPVFLQLHAVLRLKTTQILVQKFVLL